MSDGTPLPPHGPDRGWAARTLGRGPIGTIVSVKDDEVVLKVDESSNTKMIFIKSAVQRVLTDDAGVASAGR